jgi:hypothetical protein
MGRFCQYSSSIDMSKSIIPKQLGHEIAVLEKL